MDAPRVLIELAGPAATSVQASRLSQSPSDPRCAGGRCSLAGMTSRSGLDDLGSTWTLYRRPELLALDA
jgi:hypothetical protein